MKFGYSAILVGSNDDVARWERQERDADELRRAKQLKTERVGAAR